VVVGTLTVVCATLVIALVAGRPVGPDLVTHLGVTALVVVVTRTVRRWPSPSGRALVTGVTVIGGMFFLYGSLGRVAFTAVPWDADPWLRAVDRAVGLGREPAAWAAARVSGSPWAVEPLAVFYAAFIPYLYLSIFLGLVGRPARTRGVFVLGFALLYGAAFMGYLFLPARGPIASMAAVLPPSPDGGAVHALVVRTIDAMGGPHGAFPSLHVAASCLAALTDLRHGDALRGFIYLPLVALISVATVALRYHYAVDVVAGVVLAYAALGAAERVSGVLPRRRLTGARSSLPASDRPRWPYRLARALLRLSMHGFFRRVEIQGHERIPSRGPVLLVANHTNAFVDPVVLLIGLRRRLTLTAKSTLAHNPLLAPLLRAFDAVLFHRSGDEDPSAGADYNERALVECAKRLGNGEAVLVFPEGVSHSDPSMRPFKTGVARIAVAFREREPDGTLDLVPIGLHYTQKDGWRSEAVAFVGHPVDLATWIRGAAGQAGEVDVERLTNEMRIRIERLTAGYANDEERLLVERAARLLDYDPEGPAPLDRRVPLDVGERVDLLHRLRRGAHELRMRDPERFLALSAEARELSETLQQRGVAPAEVGLPMSALRAALFFVREMEVLFVGAPLALVGWLANVAPLSLTRRLVRRLSRDEDHTASNAVFIGPPVFLAWWGLSTFGAVALSGVGWGAGVAAALPLTGALALRYRDRAGGVIRRVRTFVQWLMSPRDRLDLAGRLERWIGELRDVQAGLALDDTGTASGA